MINDLAFKIFVEPSRTLNIRNATDARGRNQIVSVENIFQRMAGDVPFVDAFGLSYSFTVITDFFCWRYSSISIDLLASSIASSTVSRTCSLLPSAY